MRSLVSRVLQHVPLCGAILALAACGSLRPPGMLPPGTTLEEAQHAFGGPTGRHTLPDGSTRLEFAQGGFGKQTFMLDFDASGHLVSNQQVLTPDTFATIKPGMSTEDVLTRIGRPAFVFGIPRNQQAVWNYRFGGLEGDCVVFQVSISNPTGSVAETGQGYDPSCDGPSRE